MKGDRKGAFKETSAIKNDCHEKVIFAELEGRSEKRRKRSHFRRQMEPVPCQEKARPMKAFPPDQGMA